MNNENLNNGELIFGKKIIINNEITLIPVYKVKVNTITLDSDKLFKGNSKSVNYNPICFMEINNSNVKIHNLNDSFNFSDVIDKTPNIIDMITKIIKFNE